MVLALLASMNVFVELAGHRVAYPGGQPLTPAMVSANHLAATDVLGNLDVLQWLQLPVAGSFTPAHYSSESLRDWGSPRLILFRADWLGLMVTGGCSRRVGGQLGLTGCIMRGRARR